MSYDYRVDNNGQLLIIVSRWNNLPPPRGKGEKIVRVVVDGFHPNEPVQVEIVGDENA